MAPPRQSALRRRFDQFSKRYARLGERARGALPDRGYRPRQIKQPGRKDFALGWRGGSLRRRRRKSLAFARKRQHPFQCVLERIVAAVMMAVCLAGGVREGVRFFIDRPNSERHPSWGGCGYCCNHRSKSLQRRWAAGPGTFWALNRQWAWSGGSHVRRSVGVAGEALSVPWGTSLAASFARSPASRERIHRSVSCRLMSLVRSAGLALFIKNRPQPQFFPAPGPSA